MSEYLNYTPEKALHPELKALPSTSLCPPYSSQTSFTRPSFSPFSFSPFCSTHSTLNIYSMSTPYSLQVALPHMLRSVLTHLRAQLHRVLPTQLRGPLLETIESPFFIFWSALHRYLRMPSLLTFKPIWKDIPTHLSVFLVYCFASLAKHYREHFYSLQRSLHIHLRRSFLQN